MLPTLKSFKESKKTTYIELTSGTNFRCKVSDIREDSVIVTDIAWYHGNGHVDHRPCFHTLTLSISAIAVAGEVVGDDDDKSAVAGEFIEND